MSDIPTLANSAAPASPASAPSPSPAPASATPPAPAPRPSAPENPRARGHSPARDYREAAAARAAGEVPGEAPPSPAGDPQPPPADAGAKVKVGKYEVSESEIQDMLTRQSADDLRRAKMPPSPDAYKLEISQGAKLPGDIAVKFDGNDAGLIAAKNWAFSKGLDQGAFSEMLTLYASHVAQQESTLGARAREELAKVGPNAPQRLDAVSRWVRGEVGDADAAPIMAATVTDAQLRFLERMQEKLTSQGVGNFSQRHRAAPDDNKIPGYETMSFEQRRFAQDQKAEAARRGR